VRCHDATPSCFALKNCGWTIRLCSCNSLNKSQLYAELTVWPAGKNSFLWRINLMSKKMMSMFLTLLFTCLTFFGLSNFRLPVYCSFFFLRTLVLCAMFSALASSDPSQNRIRPDTLLQIKGSQNHHVNPAALYTHFLHWPRRYATTICNAASCYCKYCTDGSTSPTNYGFGLHIIQFIHSL
jgi:hypothetical protein